MGFNSAFKGLSIRHVVLPLPPCCAIGRTFFYLIWHLFHSYLESTSKYGSIFVGDKNITNIDSVNIVSFHDTSLDI